MKIELQIDDVGTMASEIMRLRAQVTTLQQCNNREVERRRAAEEKYEKIIDELTMLNTLQDVYDLYGVESFKGLEKAVYDGTSCGVRIKMGSWSVHSYEAPVLSIGVPSRWSTSSHVLRKPSGEVGPIEFVLPISITDWRSLVQNIEDQAEKMWKEIDDEARSKNSG
jgi:hypothetical protein